MTLTMKLTLAGLVFAGLCGADRASADGKLAVGLSPTPENASAFVAKEQSFFANRGIDAELVLIPINSTLPAALMSQSVTVAAVTPTVFLQAIDSGIDLKGFAGVSVTSKAASAIGIVARTGTEIRTAKDLEGKKVAVPARNAVLDTLARRWMKDNGADPTHVTFVEAPFPAMPDLLKSATVDALVTADPFLARVLTSGQGTLVVDLGATIPEGQLTTLYATSPEFAQSSLATLHAFRAAIDEAGTFLTKDPDAARADIGKYIKLPPEVLKTIALPKVQATLTSEQLVFWSDIMIKQGMINTPVAIDRVMVR